MIVYMLICFILGFVFGIILMSVLYICKRRTYYKDYTDRHQATDLEEFKMSIDRMAVTKKDKYTGLFI
jgi:hypothetical protein